MNNVENGQTIQIEITIKGSISPEMAGWFEGLSVKSGKGNTIISGALPDQQALYGLVNLLRNLGVSILSINMQPANE